MQLIVRHTLKFSLGTPARAVQHLLLTALPTPQQKIERWSITMPGLIEGPSFRDGFGNQVHMVSQLKPDADIVVTVSGAVETIDRSGVLGRLDHDPPPAMFRRASEATTADPALIAGLADGPERIALLHEIMDRVHHRRGAATQTQTSGTQSQSQGGGTPPDLAQEFIGAARGLGIPARYVTGYVLDEGAASFHAWAEGWDEGLGWIGFDPALNVCPTDTYIRIASGLDMIGTMPIRSVPMWTEMPDETVEITVAE